MNILYISTSMFRNSSAAMRNISLIKGLLDLGIDVDILTLNYLKEDEELFLFKYLDGYTNLKIHKIEIPKFNSIRKRLKKIKSITKKGTFVSKLKEIIKQNVFFPDNLCEAIKNAVKFKGGIYDAVISSSDSKTSHFIAERLFNEKKIMGKWVQIWGDPWAKDTTLNEANYFLKKRIETNEKKLLLKADKIFYISKITSEMIKKEILPEQQNKIDVLKRSFIFEINNSHEFNKDFITISYTGVVTDRNIIPIIDAVKKYNRNKNKIGLNFYGEVPLIADELKDDYIKFYPRVSLEKIKEIYIETDILLYIDNINGSTQIPGKIYDYCGTNKHIIALVETKETEKIISKFDGITVVKNTIESINLEDIVKHLKLRKINEEFSPKYVAREFLEKIKGE